MAAWLPLLACMADPLDIMPAAVFEPQVVSAGSPIGIVSDVQRFNWIGGDRRFAVIAGDATRIWDWRNGSCERRIDGAWQAISADGRSTIYWNGDNVLQREVAAKPDAPLREIRLEAMPRLFQGNWIVSADGSLLGTVREDERAGLAVGHAAVHSLTDGKLLATRPLKVGRRHALRFSRLGFSPDGKTFAWANEDGISVWDFRTANAEPVSIEEVAPAVLHRARRESFAFRVLDGGCVVAEAAMWDTPRPWLGVWQLPEPRPRKHFSVRGIGDSVLSAATGWQLCGVDASGRTAVIFDYRVPREGPRVPLLRRFDLRTGEEIGSTFDLDESGKTPGFLFLLTVAPSGKFVAVAQHATMRQATVRFVDLEAGKWVGSQTATASPPRVVAVSPSGNRIASMTVDPPSAPPRSNGGFSSWVVRGGGEADTFLRERLGKFCFAGEDVVATPARQVGARTPRLFKWGEPEPMPGGEEEYWHGTGLSSATLGDHLAFGTGWRPDDDSQPKVQTETVERESNGRKHRVYMEGAMMLDAGVRKRGFADWRAPAGRLPTVTLWDVAANARAADRIELSGAAFEIAASADGRRLAAVCLSPYRWRQGRILDFERDNDPAVVHFQLEVLDRRQPEKRWFQEFLGHCLALAFSADGASVFLATTAATTVWKTSDDARWSGYVFDAETGQTKSSWKRPAPTKVYHENPVSLQQNARERNPGVRGGVSLFAAVGRTGWFAHNHEDQIRVLDFATGRELARLVGPQARPVCLGASPEGRVLAAGLADGATYVWELDRIAKVATAADPAKP